MMPELAISKIMRAGLSTGLLIMLAGVFASILGVTIPLVLLDGDKLMYIGTVFVIATPLLVLIYLAIYYILAKPVKYGFYCLMIIIFLITVIFMRI